MRGNSAGLRVLVVDDVEDLRILIRRALTGRGYQVDVAATLAQARGMDPRGYDAVLVDAHLGHELGTDLVEALRSADPTAAGRCLIMTGGPLEAIPADVAFLAKPFQMDELIDAVRALHEPDAARPSDRPAGVAPSPGSTSATAVRPSARPATAPRPSARPATAPRPGKRPATVVSPGGQQPAAEPQAWQILRLLRRLRARERHELIDFLHDGPIQELTAATLELQMISRAAPAAPRFDAVIKQLNEATAALRWLVDGPWQSVQPETQLAPALHERSAWLLAAPLTVDGDGPADLAVAEVPVIADVVELMLLGMVTASPPAQAHVAVRADRHLIQVELTLTSTAGEDLAIGDPATAQAALGTLASALGARAHARLGGRCWQAQLALRRQPAARPEQSSLPAG